MLNIINEIIKERERQDKKFGVQDHDMLLWLGILAEEFGEVAKEVIENNSKNIREELIQVAAVAIAALESMDRKLNGV